VAALAAMLAVWEGAVRWRETPAWLLPPPTAIAQALVRDRALLWGHGLTTASETLLGLLAAVVVGVVLGAALAASPLLSRALSPLVVGSQAVPIVAIAPLLVIWFGYGLLPKVLVTALVAFFPIAIAWSDGLRATDRDLLSLVAASGAGRWRQFWLVAAPGALPALWSGVRIGASVAVIGAVFGELVGSSGGLGYLMTRSMATFQTDRVFAALVVLAALALAIYGLVAALERATTAWRWQGR
jgi:putative hydroxymethylpyrimidine transport system permease protein